MYADPFFVDNFWRQVKGSTNKTGSWLFPCRSRIPAMKVRVRNNGSHFILGTTFNAGLAEGMNGKLAELPGFRLPANLRCRRYLSRRPPRDVWVSECWRTVLSDILRRFQSSNTVDQLCSAGLNDDSFPISLDKLARPSRHLPLILRQTFNCLSSTCTLTKSTRPDYTAFQVESLAHSPPLHH